MFLRQEHFLGFYNFLQWEALGDQWSDVSTLDELHQVGKNLRLKRGTTEEAQVLQVQRANIESNQGAGDRPCHGIAPSGTENVKKFRPLRPGNQVNYYIYAIVPERLDETVIAPKCALSTIACEHRE